VREVIVIKLGGHALEAAASFDEVLDALALDIRELQRTGNDVVVVHGAGPQINEFLAALKIPTNFVDGLRVTDDETMDVVAMVLSLVNLKVVAALNVRGVETVGLSGADRSTLVATQIDERYGRVGSKVAVKDALIREILHAGVVVVLSPVSLDNSGALVNVNADAIAGAVAAELSATALVLLSDVDQLRADPTDERTSLSCVSASEVRAMVDSGAVRDGMVPKMQAALNALDAGARRVVVANGSRARATLDALQSRGRYTEVTP
jgi:acetylglutamate kinase